MTKNIFKKHKNICEGVVRDFLIQSYNNLKTHFYINIIKILNK